MSDWCRSFCTDTMDASLETVENREGKPVQMMEDPADSRLHDSERGEDRKEPVRAAGDSSDFVGSPDEAIGTVEAIFSLERGRTFLWKGGDSEDFDGDYLGSHYLFRSKSSREIRKENNLRRSRWHCIGLVALLFFLTVGAGMLTHETMNSHSSSSSRTNPSPATSSLNQDGEAPQGSNGDASPAESPEPQAENPPPGPLRVNLVPPEDSGQPPFLAPAGNSGETTTVVSSTTPNDAASVLAPTPAAADPKTSRTVVFYAIGDTPMSTDDATRLQGVMEKLPDDADFVIHVGDMRNSESGAPCIAHDYDSVADILKLSPAPVFLVMGDNEFQGCPNLEEGYKLWLSRFVGFDRRHWEGTAMMQGLKVSRLQSRPENFSFVFRQTLFMGLNLVDGAVHNVHEWRMRLKHEFYWARTVIRGYLQRMEDEGMQTPKVVMFGHANPKAAHDAFFYPFTEFLDEEVLASDASFLYVNGNDRTWTYEPKFRGESNFMRITVTGGTTVAPLRIQVNVDQDTEDPTLAFEHERFHG